ncbi:MAG: patatin-like phospholipase family protein [Gemmatimonadaceae bacterium]
MTETANASRWKDALGVLPLETVLAQEHDRIHGDDVTARINEIPITFAAEQIISPAAFAHRLLRAWRPLRAAGARPSGDAIDASPIVADEAPLDAVAIYVVATIADEHRHAVYKALQNCQAARDAYDTRPATASGERAHVDYEMSTRVTLADVALVDEMIPHLNYLLGQPLEEQRAFASFIEAGAIDALGDHDKNTDRRQRRLLLESAFDGQIRRIRDVRLDEVFKRVRCHDTAALCLSGGGIRSATFAIGVIRGLAHFGLLSKFDYLSTVSGGGYAGSWLSAWMHHTSAHEVQEQLRLSGREKLAPEPQPMLHLRRYSHFLTPRVGMFSTDTWTLLATIGRNLLLNWLVLIPLIASALLVPRFVVSILRIDTSELMWPLGGHERFVLLELLAVGLALGIWASRYVHRSRPDDDDDTLATAAESRSDAARIRRGTQREFIKDCFIPLVAAALLLTTALYLWWSWGAESPNIANLFSLDGPAETALNRPAAGDPLGQVASIFDLIREHSGMVKAFIGSGLLVHVGGWLSSGRLRHHPKELISVSLSGMIAGTVGMLVGVWFLSLPGTLNREMLFVTLAPPAFLGVMLVGSQLFTALSSGEASDAEREWVTRFNAWLLIAIVTWAALCALTLYGPALATEGWRQLTVAGVGGASGLLAVFLAKGESNARPGMTGTVVTILRKGGLALAAPLFVGCVIIALAAGNERLISAACELPMSARTLDCRPREPRGDDLSHSLPFVVIARHLTERVDSLSRQFRSTNADRNMEVAFARGDSIAQEMLTRGDLSASSWDALANVTFDDVWASVRAAMTADSALRERSTEFTRAVLATDSATVKGIGGDPALRALFSRRARAEVRASAAVRDRLLARDSAAAMMDFHLGRLEKEAAKAQASPDMVRSFMLGTLHNVVSDRLLRSIDAFKQVREDSTVRATSHDWVEREVTLASELVPFDGAVPGTVLILFLALGGLGLALGWKIDTNKFSLRAMYEMRLVRAYLGASRPTCDRQPNPFTGFDPLDDFPIGQLFPGEDPTSEKGGRATGSPPMHVVNVTLNLVAGGNLAWQQRKAESMTITPLHAGSPFLGYRATTVETIPSGLDGTKPRLYGGENGITLGTAVTISGAAASPNAGSRSTPAVTFLMTFFNARLGAWLGNPGRAGAKTFDRSAPVQNVKPILDEMFGLTTDISPYVYLSDGGHFENLGLYEMVLRRCRFIVVSDAGADPSATFDDLGNAVRKIRVDLGIPIEFVDGVKIFARGQTPDGEKGAYWALGRIKYSAVDVGAEDPETDGLLLYIKPAIYGQEPSDVQQYSRTSESFPHEPTSDQFFSESQFESYRALGEYIVRELVGKPLTSSLLKVNGSRPGSLLTHWNDLLRASDSNVQIPLSESGVWPTATENSVG